MKKMAFLVITLATITLNAVSTRSGKRYSEPTLIKIKINTMRIKIKNFLNPETPAHKSKGPEVSNAVNNMCNTLKNGSFIPKADRDVVQEYVIWSSSMPPWHSCQKKRSAILGKIVDSL